MMSDYLIMGMLPPPLIIFMKRGCYLKEFSLEENSNFSDKTQSRGKGRRDGTEEVGGSSAKKKGESSRLYRYL